MSISIMRSQATQSSNFIKNIKRKSNEQNISWLKQAVTSCAIENVENPGLILLAGGNDPVSFRLRVAQAHLRSDFLPSAWSVALFIQDIDPINLGESTTLGIDLTPKEWYPDHGYAPASNAIQVGKLSRFADKSRYPNLALLAIPVPSKDIAEKIRQLYKERFMLDLSALLIRWLQYSWGIGTAANPLHEGYGFPSAAMLNMAFSANSFDLSPGMGGAISSPESIWQAARYWHEYYESDISRTPIFGAYVMSHSLVPDRYYPSHQTSK